MLLPLPHIAIVTTVRYRCYRTPLSHHSCRGKSNDLMVVPVPIRKTINALKWERFCDTCSLLDDELVREFYASLTIQDATVVIV
ncbi:hypothetical protein PVK06_027154 [Gossypium arboreum]|uniref:Uncharacterized protein n=1 Tax=Gossypium arboreum TaxID=29729 RepID=A0ABR0P234_GOSAR|nr:hypothetical protein PVK06_027154 [Gossypium arboreum]